MLGRKKGALPCSFRILTAFTHGVIGPSDEDPSSFRLEFFVLYVFNVSVASSSFYDVGVLSPRSTLLLSHAGLEPAKAEFHQVLPP